MRTKLLCVFGTRPEAIKMAPLLAEISLHGAFDCRVCITAQHRQMLDQVINLFEIKVNYDLNIMKPGQTLSHVTSEVLKGIDHVLSDFAPHMVLVHGDTTTSFAAALAAFYKQIPVAHVEAGLRTGNIYSPWPEEMNRKFTGSLARLHFAPTLGARNNLLREGIYDKNIYVTGNTVIDALLSVRRKIEKDSVLSENLGQEFKFLTPNRKMVLITGHRRENFGQGFEDLCGAVRELALDFTDVDFVYPVHLNPNVQAPVNRTLSGIENVHLIAPQEYLSFVYLMMRSYIILTDSGGIQEEAPSLGKPVIVTREVTERPEAVASGAVKLVGTDREKLISTVASLLQNERLYQEMSSVANPYGDGCASQRIVHVLEAHFTRKEINAPLL